MILTITNQVTVDNFSDLINNNKQTSTQKRKQNSSKSNPIINYIY